MMRNVLNAISAQLLLLAACQGELESSEDTPSLPPDPHNQETDEIVYWESVHGGATSEVFYAVAGFDRNEVYVAGQSGRVWRWDGSSLTQAATLTTLTGETPDINGLWAWSDSQGRQLYLVGKAGSVFRYDFESGDFAPGDFARLNTNTQSVFRSVLGFGRDTIWTVGDGGVYLCDREACTRDRTVQGNPKLYGIWGSAARDPNDLYAVGLAGTVLHRVPDATGDAEYIWQSVASGRSEDLHGIWGSEDGQIFVVGQSGLILHLSAGVWEVQEELTFNHLWSVWGVGKTQVFAAGLNGTTLFYDGAGWQKLGAGTHSNLYGLWGTDISQVFSAGAQATLIAFDNDPSPPHE